MVDDDTDLAPDVEGSEPEEGGRAGSNTASESEGSAEIPLDVVFGILSNKRRRLSIEYLRSTDGTVGLSELAEHLAAVENDKPVAELTSSERKRVYVSLYQVHLPKMANAGILEFNQDRKRISFLPGASQLFPYLDIDDSQEVVDEPPRVEHTGEVREVAEELRMIVDRLEELT